MRAFLLIFFYSFGAMAQYKPDIERGLFTHKFRSPTGVTEECVIGQRFPGWDYKTRKKEAELCSMSFYDKGTEAFGICPKLNSTNPGVLMFDLEGLDKLAFEESQCRLGKKTHGKVLAKFKSSVSCSYTPSILSYYHISQMFGGTLKVPVATLRTMDIEAHKEIRKEALKTLKRLGLEKRLIGKTWKDSWGSAYSNPEGRRGRRVFTEDKTQIYGALVSNPRGEKRYREVYGRAKSYEKRFEAMTSQPAYRRVINPKDLAIIVGSTPNEESVQHLVQMRDVADMLVLDYILGQRDRPGNIHFYEMLYFSNDGIRWDKMKLKNAQKNGPHQSAKYQLPIKEMILKDNDCGIAKGNMAKKHGLLNKLKHISPKTYQNVLKFAHAWETNEAAINEYVSREWLFSKADIKAVRDDLMGLRNQLQRDCQSGELKLDLDLAQHFSGKTPSQICEL